ncbi:hypothetical protein WQ57_14155 [Mesobacillus campisalis]|uniref:Lipoprotein n=1 Tax=Mesobacillus campisalis TaxID=1408103 RepID=A0A0M2SS02_9BACI|nr:hypothetical protein [Mesobacillus campisalis]KKK37344.1 hypothetical protein WQ57_14155 [Mesobacillus campisalis]
MKKKWPLLASTLFASGMIVAGCSGAEDPAPPADDPVIEEDQAPEENQVPENNGNNLGDPDTDGGTTNDGTTNDGTTNDGTNGGSPDGGMTGGGTNGEMNGDVEAPEDGGTSGEEFETEE